MEKSFDVWNTQKKKIDSEIKVLDFCEREIWWARLGINVGVEMNGRHEVFARPVIVITKFNREMALVIPTTSKHKQHKYNIDTADQDGRKYKACLSQIRVISAKRLVRKISVIEKQKHTVLTGKVTKMILGSL